MNALLKYFDKSQKAKVVLTTSFWRHPGDAAILEYAKERGLPCVQLGDLGEQDEMKAIGLFVHEGVANHPGDLGMKKIAERIYAELEKLIKGVMVESYLVEGTQKLSEGTYGKSITDPCLGWEDTEKLLYTIAERV